MTKHKTKFIITLMLFFAFATAHSQHITNSVYSRYGLGELLDKSFGQNKGMGGTTIGISNSANLNISNPASYAYIPGQTFVFDLGYSSKFSEYKSDARTTSANNSNISYIAMGFPIAKFMKASFGLVPYSTVGYDITSSQTLLNGSRISGNVTSNFKGEGGLYSFYFGNGFKLPHGFSVGYNLNYIFGTLKQTRNSEFLDYYDLSELETENRTKVNDFYLNLGLQYAKKIKLTDKRDALLKLGIIFDNNQSLSAEQTTKTTQTINTNGIGYRYVVESDTLKTGDVELPMNIGFGASLATKHFLFALDYKQQNWKDFKSFGEKDPNLEKASRFSAGVGFIPDPNSTSYWKARQYRFGGYFGNANMQMLNNKGDYEQMKEYGVTLGMDLYWRSTQTDYNLLNLAVELGRRGTTSGGLIEESFVLVHLNFSFSSMWFFKYKFQ